MQRNNLPTPPSHLAPGRYLKKELDHMGLNSSYGFIQGEQGRYFVLEEFATGATSRVKKLINPDTNEIWVLKIIYEHKGTHITAKIAEQSYQKEYRILKALNRIDTVIIQKISSKRITKHQIIMKLAKDHDLFDLIYGEKEHLLPKNSQTLLKLALNILLDLYILHQAGILVIDEKLENIIGNYLTLEAMRVDFGFAEEGYDFKKDTGIRLPAFRGTVATAAPEVLVAAKYGRKMIVNRATDIYSVGTILRSLLMRHYFEKSSSDKYVATVSSLGQSYIRAYPEIENLLLQMTNPDPTMRPSSFATMIEPFEKALGLEKGSSIAAIYERETRDLLTTLQTRKIGLFGKLHNQPKLLENILSFSEKKPSR